MLPVDKKRPTSYVYLTIANTVARHIGNNARTNQCPVGYASFFVQQIHHTIGRVKPFSLFFSFKTPSPAEVVCYIRFSVINTLTFNFTCNPLVHPSEATMSLQVYLKHAYKEVRLALDSLLSSVDRIDGTLQPGRDNLILVYGGSFNPPHRGHVDVLLSALRFEVSPIAIVVLPSEDFHLRNKVAESHPEFFLSRERRADLWNAMPTIPKDKVWVWPSTWYPFLPFTEAVVRLAKNDGFNVAFSHLIGPDNLNRLDPLMNLPYRLPRILVSSKARHVPTHFTADGRPKLWTNFGDWSRVNSTGKFPKWCFMAACACQAEHFSCMQVTRQS